MANWVREILMRLFLIDRPVTARNRKDRRKNDRRWAGPDGHSPRALNDTRRKKERRKKERRG